MRKTVIHTLCLGVLITGLGFSLGEPAHANEMDPDELAELEEAYDPVVHDTDDAGGDSSVTLEMDSVVDNSSQGVQKDRPQNNTQDQAGDTQSTDSEQIIEALDSQDGGQADGYADQDVDDASYYEGVADGEGDPNGEISVQGVEGELDEIPQAGVADYSVWAIVGWMSLAIGVVGLVVFAIKRPEQVKKVTRS